MRCALITGCSSGIGAALARNMIAAGHTVIGLSRRIPGDISGLHTIKVDLSDLDAAVDAAKQALATYSVDTLICNAGQGKFGSLENFSSSQISANIQLNLISPLVIARTCITSLKQHSRSDIVFVGSESALTGGRYGCIYSAAKFGLRGAAQALRHECASANCHVGIVNPGMADTEFFNQLNFEPGSMPENSLQARDIADAVLSLINAPDNAVIEEINLNPLRRVVQRKKSRG